MTTTDGAADRQPSDDPGDQKPTGRTVHQLDGQGHIRDWLVSPCWTAPCDDLEKTLAASGSPWGPEGRWMLTNGPDVAPLKARLHRRRPLVTTQSLPSLVEGGELRWRAPGGHRTDSGYWRRAHTGADGLVDWSTFCFTPEYRHAVAGIAIEVDQAEWRTLEIFCTGPVAVWIDGQLHALFTDFSYMEPVRREVRYRFHSGVTPLFLATWQVAFREVRHVVGAGIRGLPVRVTIPSPGADEFVAAIAEQQLEQVGMRSWALRGRTAELTGVPGSSLLVSIDDATPLPVRLDDGQASVPVCPPADLPPPQSSNRVGTAGAGGRDGASMLHTGEVTVTVKVDDARSPVFRQLKAAVLPEPYRERPVGVDPSAWQREVLEHVAGTGPSLARALARFVLLPDRGLDPRDLTRALEMLSSRADCADFEALGLLHLLHRVPQGSWPSATRDAVLRALRDFKYWIDQPGLDAMCYFTENHQFVFHTAELLSGETLAGSTFGNTGWTAAQHAEHGRHLALEWMRRKLLGGFSEFDSNAYLAIDSLALTSLIELSSDDEMVACAEALLDKTLLTLAANSWRGVHAAAHGRSYTQTLRSSRFEETAPIMWALWGTGALNSAVLPATVLSTTRRYRLPPVIRGIANAEEAQWSGRQRYQGEYRFAHDLLSRPYASELRVWRTPDAMLSSVQDYRAGLPGLQEHVWSATLSSEVQVFATHPAAASHTSSVRPNAWAGQRVLPRASQDRDTVVVLHRFPADDPTANTHLWFPAPWCDEVATSGPWLAGRVGDGYVAVACAGGFAAVSGGDTAGQEWRPQGDGRSYVATVGRRAADGEFTDFVASLATPTFAAPSAPDPAVSWVGRDGRQISLTWAGPFLVDGRCPDLGPDGTPQLGPHLENPACLVPWGAHRLEASYAGQSLVLDLRAGRRREPTSCTALRTVRDGQ